MCAIRTAGNLKRIAELEAELARQAAAGELKLRSLRQEHERVKNGLQRQLEMSAGAAGGGGGAGVGIGSGGGGVSRKEELPANGASGKGDRDSHEQQRQSPQQVVPTSSLRGPFLFCQR